MNSRDGFFWMFLDLYSLFWSVERGFSGNFRRNEEHFPSSLRNLSLLNMFLVDGSIFLSGC